MYTLQKLAQKFGVAVIITNQIASDVNAYSGGRSIPRGGHVLAHTSTYTVSLEILGINHMRKARLVASPCYCEKDIYFVICEKGVADPNPGMGIDQ